MYTVILTSLLMAVAYIAAVIIKDKELPDSISALVYALPKKWQWVWSVWLVVVGLLACICMIDALPENFKFLGFLTLTLICFTAAMPLIIEENRNAHNLLGVGAGVFSQIAVIFLNPWWLILWPVAVVAAIIIDFADAAWAKKYSELIGGKLVFIAEMVCAITVYGSLLL